MSRRRARPLHPGAWWLWAIGLAAAASRTTNPLVLVLLAAVAGCVVALRRSDAPWARGFGLYVRLGLVLILIRVVFRALFDGRHGTTVLFTLPELDLPDAAAGIRVGGPVTLEGLSAAAYDGLRLATLLLCLGAANVLADPRRLLKALPGALHELGVAVTVSLTVAPQVVESTLRIRRARRLRGAPGRARGLVRQVLVPVLEDALDRALVLAGAMDSRGYGRRSEQDRRTRRITSALVLGGVVGVCLGTYGLLDGTTPAALRAPTLVGGCVLAVAGLRGAGRRVVRSVYRPDPWRGVEWAVVACGAVTAGAMFAAAAVAPGALHPSVQPWRWPTVPALALAAAAAALLPAWLAPPPGSAAGTSDQPGGDQPGTDRSATEAASADGAGPLRPAWRAVVAR